VKFASSSIPSVLRRSAGDGALSVARARSSLCVDVSFAEFRSVHGLRAFRVRSGLSAVDDREQPPRFRSGVSSSLSRCVRPIDSSRLLPPCASGVPAWGLARSGRERDGGRRLHLPPGLPARAGFPHRRPPGDSSASPANRAARALRRATRLPPKILSRRTTPAISARAHTTRPHSPASPRSASPDQRHARSGGTTASAHPVLASPIRPRR
jgi:hypothetical protein